MSRWRQTLARWPIHWWALGWLHTWCPWLAENIRNDPRVHAALIAYLKQAMQGALDAGVSPETLLRVVNGEEKG